MSIDSTSMGAAIGLMQAKGMFDFGVKALNQNAQQQEQTVAALLQSSGPSSGGGNVTATRGQNVNMVV